MPPIVSSKILSDSRQVDGRRWIVEQILDQSGTDWGRTYLVPPDFDAVASLAAYVATLTAESAND